MHTTGQVIAPPVKVQLRDSNGQPVNAAGIAIVLSISSGTGNLLGSIVQLTDDRPATFSDLRIADLGTQQLRASSIGNAPAISTPFQITAAAPRALRRLQVRHSPPTFDSNSLPRSKPEYWTALEIQSTGPA